MRKQAGVAQKIHLQTEAEAPASVTPTRQRGAERHASTQLSGSRSTAASTEQSCSYSSVLCRFGKLELCTYRTVLSFQQKERQAKIKNFPTRRVRVQQSYNCCWKTDRFSSSLSPSQIRKRAGRGCSEMSEDFQKTWRSWNSENDRFKLYLKIFQYPEQV